MKRIQLILFLILLAGSLFAQRKKTFLITSYGAKGDSATSNTTAIQAAIDAASQQGGTVIVPAGNFVTGVLQLRSGVELRLEKNATLLATTNRLDYGNGNASALITATTQHDIAITGEGTINGRGFEVVKNLFS